ncbi:hypothetical protein LINPERHAP1_LOCUS4842 [Linum perenne]
MASVRFPSPKNSKTNSASHGSTHWWSVCSARVLATPTCAIVFAPCGNQPTPFISLTWIKDASWLSSVMSMTTLKPSPEDLGMLSTKTYLPCASLAVRSDTSLPNARLQAQQWALLLRSYPSQPCPRRRWESGQPCPRRIASGRGWS